MVYIVPFGGLSCPFNGICCTILVVYVVPFWWYMLSHLVVYVIPFGSINWNNLYHKMGQLYHQMGQIIPQMGQHIPPKWTNYTTFGSICCPTWWYNCPLLVV